MLNIIIPLYKNKDKIVDCLNSLVAQTKKNFMVTIIQDKDDEDYSDIINYFNQFLHINFIKNVVNLGPGMTRQKGVDLDNMCDYVMFMDSDDMLNPRAVELLYTFAKSNFADIVSSKIIVEEKHKKGWVKESKRNSPWLHGRIFRKNFLKDNNIRFYEGLRCGEDVVFNFLAINQVDSKKAFYLDEETYIYRDCSSSITRENPKEFKQEEVWQMIYGLSRAFLELYNKNKINKKALTEYLVTMYQKEQMQKFGIGKMKGQEKELIGKIFNLEEIKNLLQNPIFLKEAAENITQGMYCPINKKTYFYTINFYDWAMSYINKKGEK